MLQRMQTTRNLTVLLAAVGVAVTAWAKKPDKPGGGGKEPPRYTPVVLGMVGHDISDSGQVAGFVDYGCWRTARLSSNPARHG